MAPHPSAMSTEQLMDSGLADFVRHTSNFCFKLNAKKCLAHGLN